MKVSIRLSGLIFTTCFINVITSKGQKLKTNKRGRIIFTTLDILAGFNSDAMKQFILKLTIVDNLRDRKRCHFDVSP